MPLYDLICYYLLLLQFYEYPSSLAYLYSKAYWLFSMVTNNINLELNFSFGKLIQEV